MYVYTLVLLMAEILPYKHAIVPYGAAMAGFPSEIAYGGWQKICNAIPPWHFHGHYLTTLLAKEIEYLHNTSG